MRGPVAWWNDPWRPPRFLVGITAGYLAWSLLPVAIAVLYSFNNGRSRTTWQGFSLRWYWGDSTLSVWHNDALHTALLQTLKLGVITTLITVPLGVLFAIGIDRWRGRLPEGANFLMLLSFVLPEVLLAVALLFVLTTVALPIDLGTTAQVIGLITFQVSYPAVLVRARLATIGPQYEEAAMDLGASPLGALRRIILPMLMPAIFASTVLGVRRRHRRLRAGALSVGRRVDRTGLGEDLQHGARCADARAQRAGLAAAAGGADRRGDRVPGVPLSEPGRHHHEGPGNRRIRRRGVITQR